MLSASLVNLSKQDSKLSDKLDQDLDDIQIQETYFEDEEQSDGGSQEDTNSLFLEVEHFSCNSDLQDSAQSTSPKRSQHAKDSRSIISWWPAQPRDDHKSPRVLSSVAEEEHHLGKQRCGLQPGSERQLSGILENVYGEKQGKLASNHFLQVLPEDVFAHFILTCFSCHMPFIFLLLIPFHMLAFLSRNIILRNIFNM